MEHAFCNESPLSGVVDDVPSNIEVLESILASRGYALTSAASGPAALTCIAADQPALVLLEEKYVSPGHGSWPPRRL